MWVYSPLLRAVFFIVILAVVTGCQAKGIAGKKTSGPSALVSVVIPSTSASSSSSGSSFVPSSVADFDCYAINVIAPEIKPTSVCGGESQIGVAAGFVSKGGKLQIDVPMGKSRTFQIWGYANSQGCPDIASLLNLRLGAAAPGTRSPAYLLGEKTIDVLDNKVSLSMGVSYVAGASKKLCGSLPTPTTTIDYVRLDPGTEVTSLSDGQLTSSTLDVCIGFKTNSDSPSFRCQENGVDVVCELPSSCLSYSGGYVHRFSGTANQLNTFTITTTDNTYKTTSAAVSRGWRIDTQAPTLSFLGFTPGGYSSVSDNYFTSLLRPAAIFNFFDIGTNGGSILYQIDGGAWSRCASLPTGGQVSCSFPTLTTGNHTLTMRTYDVASNSPADISTTFTIDQIAPTVAISPSDGWLWGGYLATAAGSPYAAVPSITDDPAGEASSTGLFCAVDGANAAVCPSSLSFTSSGRAGKHSVVISGKDIASNSATSITKNIFIDSLTGQTALGRLTTSLTSLVDESTNTLTVGNQPLDAGLNQPGQTALDTSSGYLYVADRGNNRVLVYGWNSSTAEVSSYRAIAVFGQQSFLSYDTGVTSTATYTPMNGPVGIALGGTPKKLFVADRGNNRVLRFDISTGHANKVADVVFGQPSSATSAANNPSSAAGLSHPTALYYYSSIDKLYVTDTDNCRVSVFNAAATTGTSGNAVATSVGATCPAAMTTTDIGAPSSIAIDTSSDRIYVADSMWNRVLVWDSASALTAGAAADDVVGQPDLMTTTAGDSMTNSGSNLTSPTGVALVTNSSGTSYVAVSSSSGSTLNKVKYYSRTGASPRSVVAELNAAGVSGTSATSLYGPTHLSWASNGYSLFVTDATNHRIGIFSTSTLISSPAMRSALGHASTSGAAISLNAGTANNPNEGKLNGATFSVADETNNRLYVSDTLNNRILVYNLDPITRKPASLFAAAVFGSGPGSGATLNVPNSTAATNADTLNQPKGLAIDSSKRLYVADSGNNRVLRFPTNGTITNGMQADLVLGQADFVTNTSGSSLAALNSPSALDVDTTGDRLFVSDTLNHRISIYSAISSITSGTSAAASVGSAAMTPTGATTDVVSAPIGVSYTQGITGVLNKGLFVADTGFNRVNYYDFSGGVPVSASACYGHRTGVAGDVTNMCASDSANDGGTLAANGDYSLSGPQGVYLSSSDQRLYISDTANKRVVVYDLTSTSNQPSNASVTTSSVNYHVLGGETQFTVQGSSSAHPAAFSAPTGIFRLAPSSSTNLLYIVDPGWHRVGVYEVP